MDETRIINRVELRGTVSEPPQFSHESRGERFFRFPLEVSRLSGTVDRINVIVRESQIDTLEPQDFGKLHVIGELRSFNNRSGQGSKLVITVFAREIEETEPAWENSVELAGTICKTPTLRQTPLGREICDILLAVNRRYGRSDYLPCIAWGLNARLSSQLQVGDRIVLLGRLQSREYTKNVEGEILRRTAFEVSVSELQPL